MKKPDKEFDINHVVSVMENRNPCVYGPPPIRRGYFFDPKDVGNDTIYGPPECFFGPKGTDNVKIDEETTGQKDKK